jgi:hypothetical protein
MNVNKPARQKGILSGLAVAAALAFSPTAHAELSFAFTFGGDFVGNLEAQQAVIDAGALYSTMFATHFTNTGKIDFSVTSVSSGVASAGTYSLVTPGFGTGEVVRNKIVSGVDLNGSDADGFINVNLGLNYQYNPSSPVDFANGQLDLYSILDHELTHALGIISLGYTTGNQARTAFDSFLTTAAGVHIWDPVTGALNDAALNDALANNALFAGSNATALNGSPVTIQGAGGDLSHLGTNQFTIPTTTVNALMLCCGNPNSPDQSEPRDFNSAEIGIMRDLGYTAVAPVSAVPEPSTYALMLAGLCGVGMFAKRRKS